MAKSLLLIFLGLNAFLSSADAAQIEFHPSMSLEEKFNDNLYLSDSNPQTDLITTVRPGIILNYKAPAAEIALDYSLNYQFYQKHSEENQDRFVDVQRTHGVAQFFTGRPLHLRVTGDITRENLDSRDSSAVYNDLVNKSTVYHLSVAPEYRWQLLPSFSLVFGYLYDRIEVIDAVKDSEGHTGSVSLEKQLSTSTVISGNYRYLKQQTDVDDNYNQQDLTLGLTQKFGPRLSGHAEAGASLVEYDSRGDETSPNWSLGLSYQLSAPLLLELDFAQKFQLSSFDGLNKSKVASASLSYTRERLKGNAELYWNEAEFVQDARQDQALGARLKLHMLFTKAFFYDLNANFERADFKPIEERVDRYGLGADLGFAYRRLLLTNGYHFQLNNSDLPGKDYRNMIISLSASLRF